MKMFVKHILFVVLKFLVLCDTYSWNECHTPRRTPGVCKSVYDCPVLFNVVSQTLNQETINQLRKYSCNTRTNDKSIVCCENDAHPCQTRENSPGFCVPLSRCPLFANVLELKPFLSNDVVRFLRNAECESTDSVARVCCPFIEKPPQIQNRYEAHQIELPTPNECGIQGLDSKIIGGEKTSLEEFPWMALLEYGPKEKPVLACGGTLITKRFVLTAAHCLSGPDAQKYGGLQRVRLGETHIHNETDCIWFLDSVDCSLPILRVDVETFSIHEKYYNIAGREHDIALIKMKQEVEFSDYVRAICLPSPDKQIPKYLSIAGWGRTSISDQSEEKLKVTVPFYDKTNCSNIYENVLKQRLGRGQICAGGVTGKDSCTGDSGGPLMGSLIENTDSVWYQFGVISFGPTPCGKPFPAVYTLVSEYVPWIKDQINKLS